MTAEYQIFIIFFYSKLSFYIIYYIYKNKEVWFSFEEDFAFNTKINFEKKNLKIKFKNKF